MTVSERQERAGSQLWPQLVAPEDLDAVEAVGLDARGLPESSYAALERAARLWPHAPAVTFLPDAARYREGRTRSFARLLADVRRTVNALAGASSSRRPVVGLLSPNNAELLTSLLAAQACGIAVPVNPGLADVHVQGILRRAGATVLVAAGPEVDARVWAAARTVAVDLSVTTLLALRPNDSGGDAPVLETLAGVDVAYLSERSQAQPVDRLRVTPPVASDLASFFHTGGTTGTPKLAAHTHANEVSDAWMVAAGSALREDAVVFAALPLFHVNALIVSLLGPLLRGRHVIWAGPLGYRDPDLYRLLWRIVEHYQLAALSGVPTVYAALARVPVEADISSLQLAAVGAAPLPPTVRRAFQRRTGLDLIEGYGLTEATCASARQLPDHPRDGSVGQRLPYQHVKAVRVGDDGSWSDLPVGQSGQLTVQGPNVFAGYVTGHDGDRARLDHLGTVRDGWLDTGDLGNVDEDGYVYLTGRAKDVIIRGGHNIDPLAVEDAVLGHPDVMAAGAVGRPDPHAGEVPVVYVTLRPGAVTSASQLQAWAGEHARETAATPREVYVIDAIPVTDLGKPYKPGLRADAVRREAEAALARAGATDARVLVELLDGSPTVTIQTSDTERVVETLSPYTFPWKLSNPADGAA